MDQLSRTLLKLIGLGFATYAVIKTAEHAPYILVQDSTYTSTDVTAVFLAHALSPLLFAFFLIYHTEFIAKLLRLPKAEGDYSSSEFERVGLSVLGTYLLFMSISDLTYHLSSLWKAHQIQSAGLVAGNMEITMLTPNEHALIVATIVELLFALYLMVGTKGYLHMFEKLRN